MSAPTPLPTPAHRAHRSTIELLKEMLEEAELGNVTEIVMVGFRADGTFLTLVSPTTAYTHQIGALVHAQFMIQCAKEREPS